MFVSLLLFSLRGLPNHPLCKNSHFGPFCLISARRRRTRGRLSAVCPGLAQAGALTGHQLRPKPFRTAQKRWKLLYRCRPAGHGVDEAARKVSSPFRAHLPSVAVDGAPAAARRCRNTQSLDISRKMTPFAASGLGCMYVAAIDERWACNLRLFALLSCRTPRPAPASSTYLQELQRAISTSFYSRKGLSDATYSITNLADQPRNDPRG